MSMLKKISEIFTGIAEHFSSLDYPGTGWLVRDPAEGIAGISKAVDGVFQKEPLEMLEGSLDVMKVVGENVLADGLAGAISSTTGFTIPAGPLSDALSPIGDAARMQAEFFIHRQLREAEAIANNIAQEAQQLIDNAMAEANKMIERVIEEQSPANILPNSYEFPAATPDYYQQDPSVYESAPYHDSTLDSALEANLAFQDQLIQQNLMEQQQWFENSQNSYSTTYNDDYFIQQQMDWQNQWEQQQSIYNTPDYFQNDGF